MFGVWQSGEMGSALADEFQRQRRTQAMNLRQVDAEDRMQCGPRIEGRRIGRFVSMTSWRQPHRGFGCSVSKTSQDNLDRQIALHDPVLVLLVTLHPLPPPHALLLTPLST